MKQFNQIILIISIVVISIILSGCALSEDQGSDQIFTSENLHKTEILNLELATSNPSKTSPVIKDFTETPVNNKTEDQKPSPVDKNETSINVDQYSLTISSPLQGISIEELNEITSNPFVFLGAGKDEGHHGTDFSFYQYKSFNQIEQLPVLAVFSGEVTSVGENRPPYGNMLIIETPLENFSDDFQSEFVKIENFNNLPNYTNLNCPNYSSQTTKIELDSLSIYTLYAHLYEVPEFELSQHVVVGNPIGEVGNSGLSGNPHLHLEFRIGPSNFEFDEMAHYENNATLKEMENYCLWRVSGFFYQVDPMKIFENYLQNR